MQLSHGNPGRRYRAAEPNAGRAVLSVPQPIPDPAERVALPRDRTRVLLRCYAELNDRLPETWRQRDIEVELIGNPSVREAIGVLGIPPAVIEVILVEGRSAGLESVLQDGDRVSLFPMFESFDVTELLRLRPRALRTLRFVADAHLGRLARYLRLLGFDTLFENDPGDREIARISAEEGRILLSRDRQLLAHRAVTHGLWIPALTPRQQVRYLIERLDLCSAFRPFTRCTVCNGTLDALGRDSPDLDVPPRVKARFDRFWRCAGCGRIYWRGSHYDRLAAFVAGLAAVGGQKGDVSTGTEDNGGLP